MHTRTHRSLAHPHFTLCIGHFTFCISLLLSSPLFAAEPTLARLSFWLAPELHADFEAEYRQKLLPILTRHGLVESSQMSRATVDSVVARLFEVLSPSDVARIWRALGRDSSWARSFRGVRASLGSPGEPARIRRTRLRIYSAPSGPGEPLVVETRTTETQGAGFWRTYTWEDGTVTLSIQAITQDSKGNIWVGAMGGVSKYDGRTWTTYTKDDGLASNYIQDICEDREGNMWFATGWTGRNAGESQGVTRFDGANWTTFTTRDGLAGNRVNAVLPDREGRMWFGTDYGATRYDPSAEPGNGDWVTFTTAHGLAHNRVRAVHQDQQGKLWFGTHSGVSRFDGQRWSTYGQGDGPAGNVVRGISEDTRGGLWFATNRGVSRYDPSPAPGEQPWHSWTARDGLASGSVWAVSEDTQGDLWFTTSSGISQFDGEAFRNYTTADVLLLNWVYSSLLDREGHLWFGTEAGINRFDGAAIASLTVEEGMSNNSAHVPIQDRDGAIWFGTLDGVNRYKGTTLTAFTAEDRSAMARVYGMAQTHDGAIWTAGSGSAACRFDGRSWHRFTVRDGLAHNSLESVSVDRQDRLWFCSRGRGVSCFDGHTWVTYTKEDGLASDWVWYAYQDRSGAMWFISAWGATRYDGSAWRTFTEADGLAQTQVTTVLEDREGNLWFGTDVAGVTRCSFSAGQGLAAWTTFTADDGLAGNSVFAILQDRRGHLWFGTYDGGVSRFDGKVFQTLRVEDGLASSSVFLHGLLEDRSGAIWISTSRGATRFRQPPPVPPSIAVDAVVTDRRYAGVSDLSVPTTAGLAAFEFHGANLKTRPGAMVYRYRLKGVDPDWTNTREERVEYLDLPRGEYTFEVFAVDRDLVYSEAPATVRLTVHLPYERFGWTAALGVALVLVAWQTARVVRRDRRLQATVSELDESNRALSSANKDLFSLNQELQRERVVERIRSQVQAMKQASDFETVLTVLAEDLRTLSVRFDTCGVDVLDQPVDEPSMAYFESHGFLYTSFTIDPDGAVTQESYVIPAPFPAVNRSAIERFAEGRVWQGRDPDLGAIVEVPIAHYGRLRLTASDRQEYEEHEVEVLQDLAAAGALGYARYLDFERLEEQNQALEVANRVIQEQTERKSRFLSSITHELRTPMNGIMGFTRIVLRRGADQLSERHRGNLSKVIQSAERLLKLIDELLDLSRIEAGRVEIHLAQFSVKELIEACCTEVSPLVDDKPDLALNTDVSGDIGEAHTDRGRLHQIVVNLLSNAIKFTEHGTVAIRAQREDDRLVVSVADTGKGIPAEALDDIFEEFEQVKGSDPQHRGSGLGLPIVKGFAELLGGTISVESEVDQGSVFTVQIPATYREPEAERRL